MSRVRDEQGVVLLLVLAMIVLTIGSVYAFARTSMLEIRTVQQRTDRVRAELLARSGLELGIRAVQDDGAGMPPQIADIETPLDPWRLLSEQPIEVLDDGLLRVTVHDVGNRLNVNALIDAEGKPREESRAFLLEVLERVIEVMPGRPEDKVYDAELLADALLDWLDIDEVSRLGDAEDSFYLSQRTPAPPANRPLLSIEELADLPGMDEPLLDSLRAYLTVHPIFPGSRSGGVNPNTAPPHVLSLIYQGTAGDKRLLGEDDVFRILRARDEGRIFCPGSTEPPCESFSSEIGRVGETVFPPLGYSTAIFSIRSEGRFGDARACFETVIDRETEPPTALSYRLDC